jgi:hypothetical protein
MSPWLAEYLHELTVFPKGKHDDQVDSTAQFLDWFKRPFPGQGVLEYYRQRAQELKQRGTSQPTPPAWAPARWNGLLRRTKRPEPRFLGPGPCPGPYSSWAT